MSNADLIHLFVLHMQTQHLAQATIRDRLRVVRWLAAFLDGTLLADATREQILRWQTSYGSKSAATVDIYTRHTQAFYRWATRYAGVRSDPTGDMISVRVPKGRPHPTSDDDLTRILISAGRLRMAYVLAAFVGLRCAEICALEGRHIDYTHGVALIHGKGSKERTVPVLAPVLAELRSRASAGRGVVLHRPTGGRYQPNGLSVATHYDLAAMGVETTLHGLRHYYATNVGRLTRDPFLVRDLLGHESVATSERYMGVQAGDVHDRLGEFATVADRALSGRDRLRIVK